MRRQEQLQGIVYNTVAKGVNLLSSVWGVVGRTFGYFGYFVPWKGSTIQPSQSGLNLQYSDKQPSFFEGSYRNAVNKAKEEFKFLLIYLHSSVHEDTPKFCNEVLCTERVSSFLEREFVLWGGDVRTEDGYMLCNYLGATTFPFFAVLVNYTHTSTIQAYLQSLNYNSRFTQSGTTVLHKIQGYVTAEELIQNLENLLNNHRPLLIAARADKETMETDRDIMEQQNRAYQESLQRDQEMEMRMREEEDRKKREEEMRIQEELEREEREKRRQYELEQLRIRREQEQQEILKVLPPEPERSENTIDVVIRLTDGTKVRRRFHNDDKIKSLLDFVSTKEHTVQKFVLTTHYPRQILSNPNLTIKESGFKSQAMLFVEECT